MASPADLPAHSADPVLGFGLRRSFIQGGALSESLYDIEMLIPRWPNPTRTVVTSPLLPFREMTCNDGTTVMYFENCSSNYDASLQEAGERLVNERIKGLFHVKRGPMNP